METLCQGLKEITIQYADGFRGEASALRDWIATCIGRFLNKPGEGSVKPSIEIAPAPGDAPCLSMEWTYSNENRLSWNMNRNGSGGMIESRLSGREEKLPAHSRLLPLENALAEALFF